MTDLENIVVAMLQRGIEGRDTLARDTDRWDKKARSKIGDTIRLTREDGEALAERGFVVRQDSGSVGWKLAPAGMAFAMPHVTYTPVDVRALLEDTLDLAYFHDEIDGEVAIPALYDPGESRCVLVLGENAGGKSFFRRLISMMTHRGRSPEAAARSGRKAVPAGPHPVQEFIPLSMEGRTQNGFISAAVYGTEEWRSTGENSGRTVSKGIETVCERTHTSIVYWDEPDIGMSAGTAAGAGLALRALFEQDAPLVQAAFITSHSPALVRQLVDIKPHYIYLGNHDGPKTLDEWFEQQANPTPVQLDQLEAIANARFKRIRKILNRNKP